MSQNLTGHDATILKAIFDPEATLDNIPTVEQSSRGHYPPEVQIKIQQSEKAALRLVNCPSPAASAISDAISQLSHLVQRYPLYAPAFNNRAQARRMLYPPDQLSTETLTEVFKDLAQAISLASPQDPGQVVVAEDARVLSSAHTHRGLLLLAAARSDQPALKLPDIEALKALDAEELEEMASRELVLGGRYGNQKAKQLAVKTNPYAKMCGSIVREAFARELSGAL